MPFSKLGLTDQLVQSVLATGYNVPTAIQTRAIPIALEGKDIIGCAQTGTGKTAAFALPILHRFIQHPSPVGTPRIRALVLVPTRELAQQVEEFFASYARFTSLQTVSIFGGASMDNQIKRLRRGADVVAATPGRLLDHINRRTLDLSHVEVLVLDEADRMLDMGFIYDVKRIIAKVPTKRQTLLFSATVSDDVKTLAASVQRNPEIIEIGERRRPVNTVTQQFFRVPRERKLPFLMHLLQNDGLTSVLVFSRTKHGADKISRRLERNGVRSVALHSNRTQAQRERALAGFKSGQYAVMVATDIAARGIDVDGISHVINYDTPAFAEDYIHRIGRTGRAEATGTSITFVADEEMKNLHAIERFIGKACPLHALPAFKETVPVAGEPTAKHTEAGHKTPDTRHPKQQERRHHAGPDARHSKQHQRNQPKRGQSSRKSGNRPQHFHERRNRTQADANAGIPRQQTNAPETAPRGPITEGDWKALLAQSEKSGSGWRKKIRNLFTRS